MTVPVNIPVLAGLRAVADRYDGFILDLWGVIHDGVAAFPGVIETLTELAQRNKRVVLLSNAPRRASRLIAQLHAMGVDRSLYAAVLSSGEAVHAALAAGDDPWFAALGSRCAQMGTIAIEPLLDGLDKQVTGIGEADFILNTGPDSADEQFDDYRAQLDAAATRRLPMICANPDLVVVVDGQIELCAGLLAQAYEETGNAVRYIGKPHAAIYRTCLSMLGIQDHRRVLAVGDAFHTDIQGATNAGLDSLFVSRGIHAQELGVQDGMPPDPERVTAMAACKNLTPVAAIGSLIW